MPNELCNINMSNDTIPANKTEIKLETPECDVLNEIYKPFFDFIRLSIKLSLPEDAIKPIKERG
jgi:hypothetical protein